MSAQTQQTDVLPLVQEQPTLDRRRSKRFSGDQSALVWGCVWARTVLTELHWRGDILLATIVLDKLLDNAVQHGIPQDIPSDRRRLTVQIGITQTGWLQLDVTDPNPAFPDFDAALRGERGSSLNQLTGLGAEITRILHAEGATKTVRAWLRPGGVEP